MPAVSAAHPRLAERFRDFAADPAHDSLYVPLAARLADEPRVLDVVAQAPPLQARPVLLFAAVHDLVLAGRAPALAALYPSAGGTTGADPTVVAEAFLTVVDDHRDAVVETLRTRTTQTNEVGRCGALLLAHGAVAAATGRPLGVVELGASAGLNLWFDTYGYRYTGDGNTGDGNTGDGNTGDGNAGDGIVPLHDDRVPLLRTALGPDAPPAPRRLPTVGHRAGIDLEPLDPGRADDARWLQACVWPDELDRLATLRAALDTAARRPPVVVRGDAIDDVGAAVAAVPAGCTPVVVHSWMLTYVPRERRPALVDALRTAAADRGEPVWWITMEAAGVVPGVGARPAEGVAPTVLGLSTVGPDGRIEHRWQVPAHPHGRRVGTP
jgi:hypothetical protein